jgi:hypothetical protein
MRVLAPACARADPAADDELAVALAGTPWSVRRTRGPGTRVALELYEEGRLADIIVATPVAAQILRGARRSRRDGQVFGLAWGCLPADGQAVSVAFTRNWPHRATLRAEVAEAAGVAWFAVTVGRFATVSAVHHDRRVQFRLSGRPLW